MTRIASRDYPPEQNSSDNDITSQVVGNKTDTEEGDSLISLSKRSGRNKIITDVTFSNDTGVVNVFTVTGDVIVQIIPVIKTDVTSVVTANVRLGVVGNIDAMIVDTESTNLDAQGIWVDQTPDHEIESTERSRDYIITNGNNIILTLDAQVDAGAITFYCYWTPLSINGAVV